MIVKTLGRNPDNDIVINNPKVSRVHLQLVRDDDGKYVVVDLNSANGTFVNGSRISGHAAIKPGDNLVVGDIPIPWLDYFTTDNLPDGNHTRQESSSPAPKRKSSRSNRVIVIAVVAALVVVVAVVLFFVVRSKQSEEDARRMVQKNEQYHNLEKEINDAIVEAANANAEYEAALRKAAESNSERDRQEADLLKMQAAQANSKVNALNSDKKKLENQLKGEQDKVNELQAENDRAKKDVQNAENKSRKEAERANVAEQRANDEAQKASNAALQAKLTTQFYEALNKARDDNRLKEVCVALGIEASRKENECYRKIVDTFSKAVSNDKRQAIINTIKKSKADE